MATDAEPVSIFVDYFGSSPNIKVLDYLISGYGFDYTMAEIANGSGVKRIAFSKIWKKLLEKKIVVKSKIMNGTNRFTLNKRSEFVKRLIRFDWEITKLEMDRAYEKKIAA
jgi:hypothetical protein